MIDTAVTVIVYSGTYMCNIVTIWFVLIAVEYLKVFLELAVNVHCYLLLILVVIIGCILTAGFFLWCGDEEALFVVRS